MFRPSIVAGRRATMLVEQALKQVRIGGRLPIVERAMELAAVAAVPAAGAAGHRRPLPALPSRRRRRGVGGGDRRQGIPRRLQPRRRGRDDPRRHGPGAGLVLGPGACARGRGRRGAGGPALLPLGRAGVGQRPAGAGDDGYLEGAARAWLGAARRRRARRCWRRSRGPRRRAWRPQASSAELSAIRPAGSRARPRSGPGPPPSPPRRRTSSGARRIPAGRPWGGGGRRGRAGGGRSG